MTSDNNKRLRMNAYYYGFNETTERSVNILLSAVACAGKAFHGTEDWNDSCSPYQNEHRGSTPVEWIQNAADDLANEMQVRRAPVVVTDAVARAAIKAWDISFYPCAMDEPKDDEIFSMKRAIEAALAVLGEGK